MTAEHVRPPIPATCEQRPTIGGVVIPWVNVQLADGGVDFRSQHESRAQTCWTQGICQMCATPIGHPIVLLGGPEQVAKLQFDEPPLHPECAVYATLACPMVAGRLERFADRELVSAGQRGAACTVPGCDCGGWVPTPGLEPATGGRPAHPWYAVYVSGYSLGVTANHTDRVHAGVVERAQVLAVRHVSTPGLGRIWKRTPLDEVACPTQGGIE
ncbi:hypothetical protein [Mycobacterium sp.]|uniref:hypothetical protein n=1 Tax=Mycobacterium sp. TaxID=1785 RepID=UPI0025E4726C|nr:hypothetical protein [Mycobacterium sp.]